MSTYDALRKKYDDFVVPAYQIECGGKPLPKDELAVYDLSVDLSVGEICGACCFEVGQVYERGARRISPTALDLLKPGKTLNISLGYGSKLTKVFWGYISELKLQFNSEELVLVVYGLDARGLMRKNLSKKIYKDTVLKDIVADVIKPYKALVSSSKYTVDDLGQEMRVVQNGDDLSFLMEIARRRGLMLYMRHNQLMMDEGSDTVCVEFTWEQMEVEFSMKYLDESIVGIGCNPLSMERFSATAPAKQGAAQESLITVTKAVALEGYFSGDSAGAVVKKQARSAIRQAMTGKIVCRALPEAEVGKSLKINKFPLASVTGRDTFFITAVGFQLNEDGFISNIEFCG